MRQLKILGVIFFLLACVGVNAQVTININSGNPNFPFPQFKEYTGGGTTLATNNPEGVPHAEMEQRMRDAYKILTNNMTYNVNNNGVYGPVTVAGVQYIMPHDGTSGADISHCTCVEGDGYYLLAAAYMADKAVFDGYYMWMHDRQFQKTQRFIDCVTNSPGYNYSPGISGAGSAGNSTNVRGGALGGNSAMDGDVDVALALLVAWKQWGNAATICTNPCTGAPVTYRGEAIKYIKTMVDTLKYAPSLPIAKYVSGVIGIDGYHKGGDSWAETTNWATGGTYLGLDPIQNGPQQNYVDYAAPGYFRSFADMLTAEAESPWCIKQYRRAEASDDWLIGQAHAQGLLPYAGQYTVTGTTPAFTSFNAAEDYRFAWRTIINYMWNGAPTRSWNPTTHQDVAGANTFEYDAAMRLATFMKAPEAAPYNNTCQTANTLTYGGPPSLKWSYNTNGTGGGAFPLNWLHGAGAPAAVVSGDADLMAQMFRHCVIEWDQYNDGAQKYLTSKARYFHEWYRLLGMMVLSGNYHDPMDFNPTANMKVYKAVNKTYAFAGDTITYTLSYRNYGKTNATSVTITDVLPAGLAFVSATGGGTLSGSTVTWNIGTVTGFTTAGGIAPTQGSVTLKVRVTAAATGRLCNTATITCSNGTGWTSNQYPNNITDVMERNCVDILTDNPLSIKKTAGRTVVSAGDTVAYTIVVKNKSVAFLNGGRPGVVVAGAHSGLSASAGSVTLKYRIYHGAHEPYINYQNYRVSYFMNKPGPPTWIAGVTVNEGCATPPTPTQQTMVQGATWNHRFLLKFPNQLATITQFLYFYSGQGRYIHEGALMPQRLVFDVHDAAYTNYNWTNDWSSEASATAVDGAVYWPIANDWTDPLVPNKVITKYHPNNCANNVTTTIQKQLVEEWDGYTWRRIAGNAPISGRELNNIVVKDTLPADVIFAGYFPGYPAGTLSGNVITWPTISNLKVGDSVVYKFWVTLKSPAYFNCPSGPTPSSFVNRASAKADNEPLALAQATVNVSCTAVPPPVTSLVKTANKASYNTGEAITYTLTYTNTDGAVVSGATALADWDLLLGSPKLNVNGAGTVDLNSASYANRAITYKYSHGLNGTLSGRLTLTAYDDRYAIIVRRNGTNWNEVRFRVEGTFVRVSVWVTSNSGGAYTQIGANQDIPYSAAPGAFDYQIKLNGTSIDVWAVNAGASIPLVPGATFSGAGIYNQAGYAGVRSSVGAAGTLANWYTKLDSAFDLQMTDPIPSAIGYTSAATTTYSAVNYTGSNVAGVVTWQTIPGPILANNVITYTWTGTVSSCPGGGVITNIAYAKLRTITPDPAGTVDVSCVAAAPVTWLYFEATAVANGNLLTWATSSEINNSHFVVERSSDGIHFEKIKTVGGAGNSQSTKEYSCLDASEISGTVYYRVVQVDYDNTSSASKVRKVTRSGFGVAVHPNPFNGSTELIVYGSSDETVSISVRNVVGAEIYTSSEVPLNKAISIGEKFSNGVYIVTVLSDHEPVNFRLVKE